MFDLFREIAQTLRNNRLRTVLTGISVSWGVFMLIVLLGASSGVSAMFESEMNARPQNLVTVWGGTTTVPYRGYPVGRKVSLRSADIQAVADADPAAMASVTPYASVDTASISSPLAVVSGGFRATGPEAFARNRYTLLAGRFVNARDMDAARRVIVVSADNARRLFGSPDPSAALGKSVSCLGIAWTVVGVFSHDWNTQSIVPYTAYKAVTGNSDGVDKLEVAVEGLQTAADGEAAESAVRQALARSQSFSPDDQGAVYVWNAFLSYLNNLQAFSILNIAVWVIGLFTLLTGIVGVSNIMFVSVRERTHEIGIRRAIGAKPRSILFQVIAESIAVTALFGYIGIVFGTLLMQVISASFDEMRLAVVNLSIALQVTVALVVTGALAGLFPALKAVKVKPVEALRDE